MAVLAVVWAVQRGRVVVKREAAGRVGEVRHGELWSGEVEKLSEEAGC